MMTQSQMDEVQRAHRALLDSATQFKLYADEHTRAGKAEKAATNNRHAERARAAAERLEKRFPGIPFNTGGQW